MSDRIKYFLIGTIFWIVVDFTTTKAVKNPALYYSKYMPALLIFYIGFPLLFSLLIYKYKMSDRRIFASTIAEAFVVEIVFTHNPLLYTFPIMILAIPITISLYSLIVFTPKWIVEGTVSANKRKLIVMLVVWMLVSLANIFGK